MILILILLFTVEVISFTLQPAEIGMDYTFTFKFNHTIDGPLQLSLYRDKNTVCRCKLEVCKDYFADEIVTSLTQVSGSEYEFRTTIKKIALRDKATWSLSYLGSAQLQHPEPLFSSFLKVFYLSLKDCPDLVEKGNVVQCSCFFNGDSIKDVNETVWYNQIGDIICDNPILKFNASNQTLGYLCRRKPVTNKKHMEIFYKPHIMVNKIKFQQHAEYWPLLLCACLTAIFLILGFTFCIYKRNQRINRDHEECKKKAKSGQYLFNFFVLIISNLKCSHNKIKRQVQSIHVDSPLYSDRLLSNSDQVVDLKDNV